MIDVYRRTTDGINLRSDDQQRIKAPLTPTTIFFAFMLIGHVTSFTRGISSSSRVASRKFLGSFSCCAQRDWRDSSAMETLSSFQPKLSSSILIRTNLENVRTGMKSSSSLAMASTDTSSVPQPTSLTAEEKANLESQIRAKGDEIKALKNSGNSGNIGPLVAELLELKGRLDPSSVKKKKKKDPQQQSKKNQKQQGGGQKSKSRGSGGGSKEDDAESDFVTPRSENYSKWYTDVIRVAGLAEASPVRGCMVIKPWGMSLWDRIRSDLDVRIAEHGAENAYFPLLIPKSFLSKEAEHIDGFAKECAVVTHHRLTAAPVSTVSSVDNESESDIIGGGLIADPEAELEEPLIIRPTSETMIWYMFRKWISSYRCVFTFLILLLTLGHFDRKLAARIIHSWIISFIFFELGLLLSTYKV